MILVAVLAVVVGATPPRPLNAANWIAIGDYPADALAQHAEGRVGVLLSVDTAGRVTSCAIATSSGSASLDTAACGLIFIRARFAPAQDEAGQAVAGRFTTGVSWHYPTDLRARPAVPAAVEVGGGAYQQGKGSSVLHVDADGVIARCEPSERTYWNVLPLPDICALFPVGVRFSPPTVRHGKPVRRKVTVELGFTGVVVR